MTTTKQKLVERVARVIHRSRQELGFGGQAQWEYEPEPIHSLHRSTAQAAITACRAEEMLELLRDTVAAYGKPGGPWNVPNEPGAWITRARVMVEEMGGVSDAMGGQS